MFEARARTLAARVGAMSPARRRVLIAIAGPPASGKTTLARRLADLLTAGGRSACHVPMDGFHLDNTVLSDRGLLHRKGAPETFDAWGFVHAVERLASEDEVVLPGFDRDADQSIAGRIVVGPEHRVAVVEGNYLCFDAEPWRRLAAAWDLSVFLAVDPETLRARLISRWQSHGLPAHEGLRRVEENDLPNARLVQARTGPVSIIIDA
jgi:pantothenate kinase